VELKHSLKQAGLFGLSATAGLVGSLALASAAQAAVVTISINPGNVPTTAADFEDTDNCENLPDDIAADVDGWVFVLPDAAGVEDNFISVTATFEDGDGGEQILSTDGDGAIVDGSGNNKAYILAPAGWTLVDAEAEVEDPAEGAQFNLTHTCPGSPGEEETTPGEEPTSPGEEPTSPGEEGSSTPGEESTSPAGSTLPTTGTPLTIALVSAAALAAGGAALFLYMRRRREAAQDW
jgi:LPXTG-motif cell wall-anchored protein